MKRIKEAEDYVNSLEAVAAPLDEVELHWFLRTYWPDYDRSMAVARDLVQPATRPEWGETARISPGGNNAWEYTLDEIYERHGVNERWCQTHVAPWAGVRSQAPSTHASRSMRNFQRTAARSYAVDLARLHPFMPSDRIVSLVHEFIPDYTKRSVQRALDEEGLRDSRRHVDDALGKLKSRLKSNGIRHRPYDPQEIETAMDKAYQYDGFICPDNRYPFYDQIAGSGFSQFPWWYGANINEDTRVLTLTVDLDETGEYTKVDVTENQMWGAYTSLDQFAYHTRDVDDVDLDACDADCILQAIVFGDVVYG